MAAAPEAPATAKSHIDPAAAFVPVQTRSERPTSFDPDEFGSPTGLEVNWKHTPVSRLSQLTEADVETRDAEITIRSAEGAVTHARVPIGTAPRGEVFVPEDVVAARAWQNSTEAHLIRIPADVEVDQPILATVRGTGAVAATHLIVDAGTNSRATVLIDHHGSGLLAENVELIVRDGAALTVVALQQWEDSAIHLSSHQARVDAAATLRHIVVTLGGDIVRVNPSVTLSGAGSAGQLYGLSFADAGQHFESQVFLYHRGPQTVGDVLYKSALQGKGARTVWIGDVLIGSAATGTDSYEANRNLVLSDGARADSIPNLEIETGDIVGAGHASATGRFDDEQLFYLLSRGIPEAQAQRMVVLGFLSEIVQKIGIPDVEQHLLAELERELTEGRHS